MKITFVLPEATLSGGVRVVAIYAKGLQQLGHEVTIVSTPKRKPSLREQWRSFKKGKGWISTQDQASHLDGLDVPHHVIDRSRPITDADVPDADIVIATWWETVEWVWRLSERKGTKVHFAQDYETWGGAEEQVNAVYRLPIPKIVIAGWMQTLLQDQFHQTPIALIPNSVDTEEFHAPPRTKQPIPTIGLLYTELRKKGCDISIKAYEIARESIPSLQLISFGIMPIVPEMPLPKGAEFIYRPPSHALKDIYSQCDAWLFGTRIEGFGLPILEAMACRTPVIGTPAGAAPELLADGCGMLVKPEDPEDMARAIVQICQASEAEWRSMSDAAYAKATGYTWEDATHRFEAALVAARSEVLATRND